MLFTPFPVCLLLLSQWTFHSLPVCLSLLSQYAFHSLPVCLSLTFLACLSPLPATFCPFPSVSFIFCQHAFHPFPAGLSLSPHMPFTPFPIYFLFSPSMPLIPFLVCLLLISQHTFQSFPNMSFILSRCACHPFSAGLSFFPACLHLPAGVHLSNNPAAPSSVVSRDPSYLSFMSTLNAPSPLSAICKLHPSSLPTCPLT